MQPNLHYTVIQLILVFFRSVKALNGTNTNNYSFTDNAPLKDVNYYRFKQFDIDGKYSFSNVVSVDFTNNVSAFSISPNPADNAITVTIPASNSVSAIFVYDINGKKVIDENLAANITSKQINVSQLAQGVYTIALLQNSKTQILKLVKK